MTGSPNLRWLLGWARRQYSLETPNLEHSVGLTDEGGGPRMRQAAAVYLGLSGSYRSSQPWALDDEGRYRTPLRAAMACIRDDAMRLYLRDLVPNALTPSVVSELHRIPKWAEADIMHKALLALWRHYLDQPPVGWVTSSESQRNAVLDAEAVA